MNETRNLFSRTTALFTRYPVLWLPLIVADVLRSIVQYYSQPIVRAALIAAAPKSAMGGLAGLPSPAKVALIGGGISLLVTLLGLLLYLYALGVVAGAVDPVSRSKRIGDLRFEIPAGLGLAWLRIGGLALLFFVFSTGFLNAVLGPLAMRSHLRPPVLQALIYACTLPVLAAVLYLAITPLRRYVLRVQAGGALSQRLPYFLVLIACAVVSNLTALLITLLTRQVPMRPSPALLLFQAAAAAVTAFPYAYATVGLSLSPRESGTDETGMA